VVLRGPWNQAYDLIEFIASEMQSDEFEDACNAALTKENAAYRMVDCRFIELTNEQQLVAIEEAVAATESLPKVQWG
jgi:hypothetical protein